MRTAPGPQFIRLSKYNCTASPRQAHHLLTRFSWCQAQHLIHPTSVLIPWAFYFKTSGWILPFGTCGCLAHINCNCFGLDVRFFPCVRPFPSFSFLGSRIDLPIYPFASGLCQMIKGSKGCRKQAKTTLHKFCFSQM